MINTKFLNYTINILSNFDKNNNKKEFYHKVVEILNKISETDILWTLLFKKIFNEHYKNENLNKTLFFKEYNKILIFFKSLDELDGNKRFEVLFMELSKARYYTLLSNIINNNINLNIKLYDISDLVLKNASFNVFLPETEKNTEIFLNLIINGYISLKKTIHFKIGNQFNALSFHEFALTFGFVDLFYNVVNIYNLYDINYIYYMCAVVISKNRDDIFTKIIRKFNLDINRPFAIESKLFFKNYERIYHDIPKELTLTLFNCSMLCKKTTMLKWFINRSDIIIDKNKVFMLFLKICNKEISELLFKHII